MSSSGQIAFRLDEEMVSATILSDNMHDMSYRKCPSYQQRSVLCRSQIFFASWRFKFRVVVYTRGVNTIRMKSRTAGQALVDLIALIRLIPKLTILMGWTVVLFIVTTASHIIGFVLAQPPYGPPSPAPYPPGVCHYVG